jgi:hypothetical protein
VRETGLIPGTHIITWFNSGFIKGLCIKGIKCEYIVNKVRVCFATVINSIFKAL